MRSPIIIIFYVLNNKNYKLQSVHFDQNLSHNSHTLKPPVRISGGVVQQKQKWWGQNPGPPEIRMTDSSCTLRQQCSAKFVNAVDMCVCVCMQAEVCFGSLLCNRLSALIWRNSTWKSALLLSVMFLLPHFLPSPKALTLLWNCTFTHITAEVSQALLHSKNKWNKETKRWLAKTSWLWNNLQQRRALLDGFHCPTARWGTVDF